MSRRGRRRWRSRSSATTASSPKPPKPRRNSPSSSRRARSGPDKPITALTLEQPGEKEVDFTAITKWAGKRQAFILEVTPAGRATVGARAGAGGFPAPELETPSDGMQLTDLATFFRWKQVKGAMTLTCRAQPKVVVTPATAAKLNKWDAATGTQTLRLSHQEGAVEVGVAHTR